MKKIITAAATLSLSSFSSAVLAHMGHGSHQAILAAGEAHSMLGFEHVLLIAASMVGLYLVLDRVRK